MPTLISLDSIVFDGSIYPRQRPSTSTINEYADALASGAKFPPIILEADTNRLLDGYHRWKAYLKCQEPEKYDFLDNEQSKQVPKEIPCEYHTIPEGVTPKLYALHLSSTHGVRPSYADKEKAALEQFSKFPGTPVSTIAEYAGVTEKTAKKYISSLIAEHEENKRDIVMRLNFLGWTQKEISDTLSDLYPNAKGTSQQWIANFLPENGKFQKLVKNDLNKGHEPATVARRYNMPEILVWSIGLDGESDQDRMENLGITIQPYDVWNFYKCDDLFGRKHPGRIPGQLVAHVLYFFTEQGDVVIDPMSGSGTTQDVCLAMNRQCYAFDIDNRHERRDVMIHDIATDGWHDRIKKADLIFWDPPYFDKMDKGNIGDDGYIEGSISAMERNEYLSFFSDALSSAYQSVKDGTRLAFLMSDWDDHDSDREGIFLWDYAEILQDAGWKLKRHIQVPLSTQQVHPSIFNKFKESKRLARLERYILVGEK
jgi:DNA modification methylase